MRAGITARILVVEDEPSDQVLIVEALRKILPKNAFIHAVEDGQEAITYLMGEGRYSDRAKWPYPSLILTDLKMPRGDGFSVLEHRRANPTWGVIPIVVLSSSEDLDDIRTAYALGANSYYIKPMHFDALKRLLQLVWDYWQASEIPAVGTGGEQVRTDAKGKLGERFPQPARKQQARVQRPKG